MTWPVHRSSSLPMRLAASCGLREGVAEHRAHAAARGVHVALHALQAHLRREVGLRLRRARESDQQRAPPASRTAIRADHRAAPALTSKDMSVVAARLAVGIAVEHVARVVGERRGPVAAHRELIAAGRRAAAPSVSSTTFCRPARNAHAGERHGLIGCHRAARSVSLFDERAVDVAVEDDGELAEAGGRLLRGGGNAADDDQLIGAAPTLAARRRRSSRARGRSAPA